MSSHNIFLVEIRRKSSFIYHPIPTINIWAMSRENLSSGVSDRVSLKPVCAATETRQRLEILDFPSISIILSRQWTTKALISLSGCAGWSAPLLFAYGIKQVFFMTRLICFSAFQRSESLSGHDDAECSHHCPACNTTLHPLITSPPAQAKPWALRNKHLMPFLRLGMTSQGWTTLRL